MNPDESAAALALATKLSGGMQPPPQPQNPDPLQQPVPQEGQQGQQQGQPDQKQQKDELDKRFAEFELKLSKDLEEKIGKEISKMTDVILGSL